MRSILFLAPLALVPCLALTVKENTNTVDTRACMPPHDDYPFCDTTLDVSARVANLISLLHDDEKPPLLTARASSGGGGGSPGPPANVSRIGLPEYDWGVNCIHGVQTSCVELKTGEVVCPTSFPNPVNFGATFNSSLYKEMGSVIGTELRALWRLGATEEDRWSGRSHAGLDCWSPNININRDPRWGRNQEVPSEDPFLNGRFGVGYTQGLQELDGGKDNRFMQVAVTLKHWDAYSLEDSDGATRMNFNAIISNSTLADTYWPAWQASIQEGQARGIMCSYNAINGVPTCANPLLSARLKQWDYDGYITSDTGAVEGIYKDHHYTETAAEAACKAITDGMCHIDSGAVYHDALLDGVQQGHCAMSDVDKAITETMKVRFELGLFDPIEDQPYWKVPAAVVNDTSAFELNLLATLESMVLLKNQGDVLPLAAGKTVAVVGPHSEAKGALVGNYLGQLCPDDTLNCITTPLEAIAAWNKGGTTTQSDGCDVTGNDTSKIAAAVAVAKEADVVVLVLGINLGVEGEAHDRVDIDLPAIQHTLAKAITDTGKPVVLVLINGGMVAIEPEMATVKAIVSAGYPGFRGSEAIARTLFGSNSNLGGRLPYTVYPADYINEVKMSDMEMTSGPGRSYRYYTGKPLFKFGEGMSLTTFTVHNVSAPSRAEATLDTTDAVILSYTVNVTNSGKRTGDDVLFAYMWPPATHTASSGLIKQLVGFERVHLAPGQSEVVEFSLPASAFELVLPSGDRARVPGEFQVEITDGTQSQLHGVAMRGDAVVTDRFPAV